MNPVTPVLQLPNPPAGLPPGFSRSAGGDLREIASQFEALLLAQMFRHMRAAGSGGWLGAGEDQAGVTSIELAEEELARALAAQGGLGLAALIENSLRTATTIVPGSGR